MPLYEPGVGGVVAPAPSIQKLMERVLALRDRSPSPDVLRAVETLTTLTRAEHAARGGLTGDLLDRVILYLESSQPDPGRLRDLTAVLEDLEAASAIGAYC